MVLQASFRLPPAAFWSSNALCSWLPTIIDVTLTPHRSLFSPSTQQRNDSHLPLLYVPLLSSYGVTTETTEALVHLQGFRGISFEPKGRPLLTEQYSGVDSNDNNRHLLYIGVD